MPLEKCPVCSETVSTSLLEKHLAKHPECPKCGEKMGPIGYCSNCEDDDIPF